MRIAQNKCISFCSELPPCGHINPSHFRKINWLPVVGRVELYTSTTLFKYWKKIAPSYLNNMFILSLNNCNTRSQMALDILLFRAIEGQKSMSLVGPKSPNKVTLNIKTAGTEYSFRHRLKKEILTKLQEWTIFIDFYYYCCYFSLFFILFCFFTIFLCVHTFREILIEIKTVLDLSSSSLPSSIQRYIFF